MLLFPSMLATMLSGSPITSIVSASKKRPGSSTNESAWQSAVPLAMVSFRYGSITSSPASYQRKWSPSRISSELGWTRAGSKGSTLIKPRAIRSRICQSTRIIGLNMGGERL